MDKQSRASKIAAWIIVSINLVAIICCTLFITFGLWCIASPHSLASAIHAFGRPSLIVLFTPEVLNIQSGVGIILVSSVIFFISFMGLQGAISKSSFMLFMYTSLIILLLLLECALLFYFSSDLLENGLREEDGQWSHAIRLVSKCCDYNTSREVNMKLPWSCCGEGGYPDNCTRMDVYKEDCKETISNWLDRYLSTIYISVAVLHIILASCSLIRRSRISSRSGS